MTSSIIQESLIKQYNTRTGNDVASGKDATIKMRSGSHANIKIRRQWCHKRSGNHATVNGNDAQSKSLSSKMANETRQSCGNIWMTGVCWRQVSVRTSTFPINWE